LFPAWTYNGRVPGPTLRVTEGDSIRIVFRNRGSHPHTMHFHGIHAARMDGVPGFGKSFQAANSPTRSTQSRSAATSITVTHCP
ncbi:multicopper oxidase domain-containing protein, partial [Streptococcus suis]